MKINNFKLVLAFVALAALLMACQEESEQDQLPTSLEERAQMRWDSLVNQDFSSAWALYSPSYREMRSVEAFRQQMQGRPVTWLAAEVVDTTCEEQNKCQVTVNVTYRATGAPNELSKVEVSRDIREEWIQLQGEWWYRDN